MNKKHSVLVTLIILVWLPYLVSVFNFPDVTIAKIEKHFQQSTADGEASKLKTGTEEELRQSVKKDVWVSWLTNLMLFLLGTLSGVMAFFNIRFWKSAVAIMSVVVLSIHAVSIINIPLSEYSGSFSAIWNMKMIMASVVKRTAGLEGYLIFIYMNLVLPLLHVLILILVTRISWLGFRHQNKSQLA